MNLGEHARELKMTREEEWRGLIVEFWGVGSASSKRAIEINASADESYTLTSQDQERGGPDGKRRR